MIKEKTRKIKEIIKWLKVWQSILFNEKFLFSYDEINTFARRIMYDWVKSIKVIDWLEEVYSIYF
jgi:hypothetical protein